MSKDCVYFDDPNLPELPLFKEGASRDDQAKTMGRFAEDFQAHARSSDPKTSHQAAEDVKSKLPGLEARVLLSIRSAGDDGRNIFEVVTETGIPVQTCSPRLAPLRRKGLIADSGVRRPGGTGKAQIVWRAI